MAERRLKNQEPSKDGTISVFVNPELADMVRLLCLSKDVSASSVVNSILADNLLYHISQVPNRVPLDVLESDSKVASPAVKSISQAEINRRLRLMCEPEEPEQFEITE